MPNTDSSELDLRQYVSVVLRRKWVVLAVLAVAVVIAAAYALTATPVYQAAAQVIVDTEMVQSINLVQGAGGQIRDANDYFASQKEILATRQFLDRVARRLQLDKSRYFEELKRLRAIEDRGFLRSTTRAITGLFASKAKETAPALAVPVKSAEEIDPFVINVMSDSIRGEVGRARNIMKISCVATNPGVAAAIANAAAEELVDYNLSLRVKPYENASKWLGSLVADSQKRVEKMEQKMKGVRREKGEEATLTQQFQVLFAQLGESESRKQEAEARFNRLRAAVDSPGTLMENREVLANSFVMGLRSEKQNLTSQLADLSEKYGPQHPQIIKVTTRIKAVDKSIADEARKMLDAARADVVAADNRAALLRRSLEDKKRELLEISEQDTRSYVLGEEADNSKKFYEMLSSRLEELTLSMKTGNVSILQIMEPASLPKSPIKPRRGMIFQFAVFAGLFGGLFLAFFLEHLDSSVKTPGDVEKYLKAPFLDIVPRMDASKGPIFITAAPASPVAESFRTIRTGLLLASVDDPPKVILVTSALPNEGKTTVSANLAVAFAQLGERVLVIDTDMRRHNLHELFGFEASSGLRDVLLNPDTLATTIKKVKGFSTLAVLTGGTTAPNPSELLSSDRMKRLVTFARQHFDRIILDAPPLRLFSDSLVLSQLADGVVVVAWAGSSPRGLLQQALDSLRGVKANILGVVLNKVDVARTSGYYSYAYHYADYYSKKKGSKRKTT